MSRRVSQLVAGWRTGLPRPALILQAGNALNYFGYGLVLPFEIIYLHQIRGFSTSTAGLVLAAIMGSSAIVTAPTGALLDRYSAKALVVAGSLASALGYAGFAFVEHPWQGFACSVVSGVGLGVAGTANRTLVVRLIRPEQRAAAFALSRVAGNFGIGAGATAGGFIVAAAQRLSTFQLLYVFDAVTAENQAAVKDWIVGLGFTDVSDVKDRGYFFSVYMRSPGGALIELAYPSEQGFLIDESEDELGTHMCIPPHWENRRSEISQLEPIDTEEKVVG